MKHFSVVTRLFSFVGLGGPFYLVTHHYQKLIMTAVKEIMYVYYRLLITFHKSGKRLIITDERSGVADDK